MTSSTRSWARSIRRGSTTRTISARAAPTTTCCVRRRSDPKTLAELRTFSGRAIDVPSMFIGGKSDWGVYQTPGAVEKMQSTACSHLVGFHLVDGAGHWVQQEQPDQVSTLLRQFL